MVSVEATVKSNRLVIAFTGVTEVVRLPIVACDWPLY